jgi:hypothetical protein
MMRTETAWVDSWLGEEMGGDNHLPSHPSLTTAQLNNREGWSSSIAPSHLSPLPSPSGVSKLHLANPPHRAPQRAPYAQRGHLPFANAVMSAHALRSAFAVNGFPPRSKSVRRRLEKR